MSAVVVVPHETNELVEAQVLVDGVQVTTGVRFQLTLRTSGVQARPTGPWVDAVLRDGKTLFRVQGLARSDYNVWAQCSRGDEVAVMFVGIVSLT